MLHDQIADVFNIIKSMEKEGRKECDMPSSKIIEGILAVMKNNNYIGEFKQKKNKFNVKLLGKINDCGVIKPRFSVNIDDIIKFEKRFLPSANVGVLIISTSKGIVSQGEAVKDNVGGVLLGYVW
ncbi:MAG: 30S ribosomal protein S8 [Candidatus Aenigmarchaeota archaeon]|nr:30S ribosomal protein S8 [Candidatus Aenigmarchaeota archaeon]